MMVMVDCVIEGLISLLRDEVDDLCIEGLISLLRDEVDDLGIEGLISLLPLVKVQWKHHNEREAFWEMESEMQEKYPELFVPAQA